MRIQGQKRETKLTENSYDKTDSNF